MTDPRGMHYEVWAGVPTGVPLANYHCATCCAAQLRIAVALERIVALLSREANPDERDAAR